MSRHQRRCPWVDTTKKSHTRAMQNSFQVIKKYQLCMGLTEQQPSSHEVCRTQQENKNSWCLLFENRSFKCRSRKIWKYFRVENQELNTLLKSKPVEESVGEAPALPCLFNNLEVCILLPSMWVACAECAKHLLSFFFKCYQTF